jgi:hypothetical protein
MQLKNATVDGLSGGCLNASVGSSVTQYSSSHSIGSSRSKLDLVSLAEGSLEVRAEAHSSS